MQQIEIVYKKQREPRNYCFIAAAIMSLIAVVLGSVGLATNYWLEVTITSGTLGTTGGVVSMDAQYGVWQSCVSGSRCTDYKFSDFTCTGSTTIRFGSDFEARLNGVKAMMFVGILLNVIAIITSAFCYKHMSRWLWIATIILNLLDTFGFGAALVVYVHTFSDWANCDHDFCTGKVGCTERYGYSFGLACGALGVSFLTIWITIFGNRQANRAQKAASNMRAIEHAGGNNPISMSQMRPPSPRGLGSPERQQQPATSPRNVAAGTAGVVMRNDVGVDDEWRFDESSGMFWSDKQSLYLDTTSGQYYDPTSEQWYNPDTGAWAPAN